MGDALQIILALAYVNVISLFFIEHGRLIYL